MAIKSLFFNAASEANIDRVYDTQDWADYFEGIVSTGVLMQSETSLKAEATTGMNIVVKAGSAYIEGRKLILDTDTIFPIQGSHATYTRVDAVVMAKDMLNRKMNIYVKTGIPSSTPTYPALVNDTNLVEHLLATVAVPAGATTITSSNVTDMRGSDCNCIYGNDKMQNIYHERYETLGDSVGWYDNVNVSKIVNAFLTNGKYQSYDFSNADANAQLKLEIIGEFNITENSKLVSNAFGYFYFVGGTGLMKKVILDFSKCVINFNFNSKPSMSALFSMHPYDVGDLIELHNLKINGVLNNVTSGFDVIQNFGKVKNARMRIVNYSAADVTGIDLGSNENGIIENCYVEIISQGTTSNANNIIGFRVYGATEANLPHRVVNCTARLLTSANTYYTLQGYVGNATYDNCNAYVYNIGDETLAYSAGFESKDKYGTENGTAIYTNCVANVTGKAEIVGFAGKGRYVNCRSHAASNTSISKYCAAFAILGEATNCEALARNAGNGSAYGVITTIGATSGSLKLINCNARGYCSAYQETTDTVYAVGIGVNGTNAGLKLVCIGCEVPKVTWTNFVQKSSIRIEGTTSGTTGRLIGNILYTASTKHTGTNLVETDTIIG